MTSSQLGGGASTKHGVRTYIVVGGADGSVKFYDLKFRIEVRNSRIRILSIVMMIRAGRGYIWLQYYSILPSYTKLHNTTLQYITLH
jgi:hypothetical protein